MTDRSWSYHTCGLRIRSDIALAPRASSFEALQEMLCHTYASRYGSQVLPSEVAVRRLQQCAEVIHEHQVIRLNVPDGLFLLSETVSALETSLRHAT